MSKQGWTKVDKNNKNNKNNKEKPLQFDPIISRQKEALAKLEALKQESKQIKYDEPKDPNQDWNYITISKTKPKQKVSTIQSKPSAIKENEEGIIKIKKVSKVMSKAVIDGRVAKKMTQIQLANSSTLDVKTISEIERGGCIYDANAFNKISKALGIKIERSYDMV